MRTINNKIREVILKGHRAISGMWSGFLVFVIILFLYGAFLSPFITGFVGPLTSPLGGFAQIITFIIVALITYYIYAFVVHRTHADPETE